MTARSWAALAALAMMIVASTTGCAESASHRVWRCADVLTPPAGNITDLQQVETTKQTVLLDSPGGREVAWIAKGSPLIVVFDPDSEKHQNWPLVGCWKSKKLSDDNAFVGVVDPKAVRPKE